MSMKWPVCAVPTPRYAEKSGCGSSGQKEEEGAEPESIPGLAP